MIDPRVASGLRDILPPSMIVRERALRAFRDTLGRFGFVPIETPHIERMEVLTGKGAGSDEVLRQIYDVTNKGGDPGELGLRFDLTVPLARFIAKNQAQLTRPFKRYAVGSVFRGERPAKGRFREFMQCDFDVVGTDSPVADAEVASAIVEALRAIGVEGFTLTLNHRKILRALLAEGGLEARSAQVLRSLDKLDKVGRAGVTDELVASGIDLDQATRVLDFVEGGRGGVDILDAIEAKLGHLPEGAEGVANLREILRLLEAGGVSLGAVRVDVGLARGLDYYTGVVFETTVDGWERFGSVASGGRYDNLTKLFTDQPWPGVGASIGLDRLLSLLEEAKRLPDGPPSVPVLVPRVPGADPSVAVELAARLRRAGVGAEAYPDPIPLGKQMQYGSSRGHRFAVIAGPDEAESEAQTFHLRDLQTRAERKRIARVELESVVIEALGEGPGAPR